MSPEESAAAFSNLYLRPGEPNIEERQKATRYIHDKLQKEMRLKPDWSVINKIKSNFVSIQKKGGWIQKAVDPAHKGYELNKIYDISDETARKLIKLGYEFEIV